MDRQTVGCAGFGYDLSGANFVNSPSNAVSGSRHMRRITSMYSSVRRPRRSNGTPSASNSSRIQPTPMPSSTRPPDRRSRVATSFASTSGLRCGRIRMPVAEANARGRGRDVREPDQRVGDRDVLAAGHLAVGRVRVRRLVSRRHDDVLDGPQRLEPELLRESREADRDSRIRERPGIRERQSRTSCETLRHVGAAIGADGPSGPSRARLFRRCASGSWGRRARPVAASRPGSRVSATRCCSVPERSRRPSGASTSSRSEWGDRVAGR